MADNHSDLQDEQTDLEESLTAALLLLLSAGRAHTDALAQSLADSALTVSAFIDGLREHLTAAQPQAASLGRQRAGNAEPLGEADVLFGASVMAEQEPFLTQFLADLSKTDGDYYNADGTLRLARVQWRAGLYILRLIGTANEAWAATQPQFTLFYWHLGGAEKHCGDCPGLQARSPYTHETLPTVPCAGLTQCLVNCSCWLSTSAGRQSFRLPAPQAEGEG